jgi:hypothetical protein
MSLSSWKPGAMLQFQQSLPKLPVPPLQQTMDKYLKAIRPLLEKNELERTAHIIEEFKKSKEAQLLQDLLEQRAKEHANWVGMLRDGSKCLIASASLHTYIHKILNPCIHTVDIFYAIICYDAVQIVTVTVTATSIKAFSMHSLSMSCRSSGRKQYPRL